MKVKTAELIDLALDWAAAKCNEENKPFITKGGKVFCRATDNYGHFSPSTVWSQGGPIIEREKIDLEHTNWTPPLCFAKILGDTERYEGATTPIAAMRCYVASKLGDEVEVPEELK